MYIALFLAEEFLKVEEALEKVEEALAHLNICLTYPFIPKKILFLLQYFDSLCI